MERFLVKNKRYVLVEGEEKVKSKTLVHFSNYVNNIKDKKIHHEKGQISRDYLNFINSSSEDFFDTTIKNLIVGEIWKLERYSVGLGDMLLNIVSNYFNIFPNNIDSFNRSHASQYFKNYFKNIRISSNCYKFQKHHLDIYCNMIKDPEAKSICKKIIEILNPDELVNLEKSNREKTTIRKTDRIYLDINFDNDFLMGKEKILLTDYKVILIDGFIDSVGEIHHLLQIASENKDSYVVFCKGMRDEVKHTILLNLQRGTIKVYPVSLDIDEENVNILSDISAILSTDIVSSTKGDIISVEMKKDLPIRRTLEIRKQGIRVDYK